MLGGEVWVVQEQVVDWRAQVIAADWKVQVGLEVGQWAPVVDWETQVPERGRSPLVVVLGWRAWQVPAQVEAAVLGSFLGL